MEAVTAALAHQSFLFYNNPLAQDLARAWEVACETLRIPALGEVGVAGGAAARDLINATQSSARFCWLVAQPAARLTGLALYWLAWLVYKYVLVEGLYQHGLSQLQYLCKTLWDWQTSLTPEQCAMEAGAVVAIYALYRLHKYLKRQQYLAKLAVWMDRQQKQWSKAYKTAIRHIARSSILLAAMTTHILFVALAAALVLLLPSSVMGVLARPKVIGVLSFWFPIFATFTSLIEYDAQQQQPKSKKNRQSNATTTDTANTTLTGRLFGQGKTNDNNTKEAPSRMFASSEDSLEEELQDWLRFWMVRGAVEGLKNLLSWFTPSWCQGYLLQLELLFYLWIYYLPFIQPQAIAGQELPEGRPLRVLCRYLRPYAKRATEGISGSVPTEFWQTQVVGYTRTVLAGLVLVRVLKQSTADWLVHVLEEGRPVVIPGLTLFMPGFITRYGIVYVQYVLSIAKTTTNVRAIKRKNTSSSNNKEPATMRLWLRYWILNALVDATLQHFSSLLWWIPFSNHVIFLLWCYLSFPKSVDYWYNGMETELKRFGLIASDSTTTGDGNDSLEDSHTARFLTWIWRMLPKASEDTDADQPCEELKEAETPQEAAAASTSVVSESQDEAAKSLTTTASNDTSELVDDNDKIGEVQDPLESVQPSEDKGSDQPVATGAPSASQQEEDAAIDDSYVMMSKDQDDNDNEEELGDTIADAPASVQKTKKKKNATAQPTTRRATRSQTRALKRRSPNVPGESSSRSGASSK